MCLTTTANPTSPEKRSTDPTMEKAATDESPRSLLKRSSAPATMTSTIKKSVSDTNLFAMAGDFDASEADDLFYVPGGGDDDSSTEEDTFGMFATTDDEEDGTFEVDVDEVDVDDYEDDFDGPIPEIPTPQSVKKTVSFGNLEELSFPVVQGDPNFEMAYPMTLGWDSMDSSITSVDAYEQKRRGCRRSSEDLRTMSEERRKIIKNCKKLAKEAEKQKAANRGGRPQLVRRNSMSNGMMFGRDKRRNKVQKFLTKMSGKMGGKK